MKRDNDKRKISTSVVAREMKQDPQIVFEKLATLGLIKKNVNGWELTKEGKARGGFYIENTSGRDIVWPETIKNELASDVRPILKIDSDGRVKVSSLGKYYGIPAHQINSIFVDLGRLKKYPNGWDLTESGKNFGGVKDNTFEGHTYVRWPINVIKDPIFITKIRELKENAPCKSNSNIGDRGLDSKRVFVRKQNNGSNRPIKQIELNHLDPREFKNVLVSFDRDYGILFSRQHYIAASDRTRFVSIYEKYQQLTKDPLILQYLKTNAIAVENRVL